MIMKPWSVKFHLANFVMGHHADFTSPCLKDVGSIAPYEGLMNDLY